MISDEQLMELGKLACQRCETAMHSVGQLLDDEQQAIELLLNVINSMLRGCATLIASYDQKDDGSELTAQEAIVSLLATLAKANGIAEIKVPEGRERAN